MALMWPRELPEHIQADPRRASERRVYAKLSQVLGDDWSVYYSRPWWGINSRGGEIDGEADFIVAHRDKGILFLEVKGGGISFSPDTAKWQTKDRNGITHNIKDPALQASSCKHQFLNKLKKIDGWPKGYIRFRHGVVFPDSKSSNSSLITLGGHEIELFCFADEFDLKFQNWLEERLREHNLGGQGGEIGPSDIGIHCLNSLIAEPVKLKVPLRREVDGEIIQMEQLLTGIQLAIINILLSKNRVLVEGGAGTGKTVLAIESAIRESQLGKNVLFCCRSGPLAKFVTSKLESFDNIEVKTIDDLEFLLCGHKFLDLAKKSKWDSIYVDEGQDIDLDWWDHFDSVEDIQLKIFSDSNQAIYRNRDDLATRMNAIAIPLGINLRNTQKIASVTDHLYTGPLIQCFGPQGVPPEINECNIDQAKQWAVDLTYNLNTHDSVPYGMIAILVPNAEVREEVIILLSKRKIPATDATRQIENSVIVETAGRFKGLESPIVLLLTDRMLSKNQELSYVAVSRARTRLFIFGVTVGTVLGNALNY
jgi:hypothetical protein